ncbi:MAG: hypothetical protein Q8O91_11740 [Candidatus Aminicenantes bacterium]|nr:hypothetical protein [Candidatus Aminicenantes bacterium]
MDMAPKQAIVVMPAFNAEMTLVTFKLHKKGLALLAMFSGGAGSPGYKG